MSGWVFPPDQKCRCCTVDICDGYILSRRLDRFMNYVDRIGKDGAIPNDERSCKQLVAVS